MSGAEPVDPSGIPVFTGDLALLDTKVTALSGHGAAIAAAAGDVHSSFGGLSAFYKAPEAERLFATTAPVAATGLSLSAELCVIAGALSTYSDDAFPLVERLKELKRDAVAFRVRAEGDDKWREDGDLVEENNRRRGEIAEVWAAFQEVERACHAKIVALVGGKALKTDDGSGRKGTYGYDAEALKQAESLPWGEAVEESTPWWQVWEHAYDFGKGFLVDGVWGTLKGLGTLAGFEGGDAAGEAWTGLAKLATGLSPAAMLALHALPGDHSAWIRDSQTAVRETGKALIAWDQWGSNPSRAAGAVTFNVLTTVFTGGTGSAAAGAGKAGLAAKALSLTSRTARAVDPMTYVFKGAGAGLRKVGDVMAGLKGLGRVEFPPLPDHVITLPEGTVRLPDGTVRLPEGATVPEGATALPDGTVKLPDKAVALPEGTVRLPTDPGEPARYIDSKYNLLDENGDVLQNVKDAHVEGSPDTPSNTPHTGSPERQPALVGAGTHPPGTSGHVGSGLDNDLRGTGHSGSDFPGDAADGRKTSAGGDHGAPGDDGSPQAGSHSDDGLPPEEPRPFERGGETEHQIRDQLRDSKVKPKDLETTLANLAKHPSGQEVADLIVSGRFNGLTNYDQVVSSLSQKSGMSGGIEQLRLAERLQRHGVADISFEIKRDTEIKPGVVTGFHTDMDVMARDANGKVYGYQFKEIAKPSTVFDKIWKSSKQLDNSGADVKIFVVDTKGSMADMLATDVQSELARLHTRKDLLVVLRVEDGTLMYPPGADFLPGGRP
ncbi:hypothetical protein ACFVFH_04205 [Streptomyces sp. NPDC057697]|uniref:hypothetical protein n=1 Tax=Streptomyces sp. NPDC057697 TaxID=3346219 RepID=UPI00369A9653